MPLPRYWSLPTELVDSRKRKKMETDSRDTILTERRCCLERTLEARSCTQIDMEMRCAILTSSDTNSSSPDALVAWPGCDFALGGFPVVRRMASSLCTARKEEGIADSTTERAKTMPMSSSSERWASCAASSSSFAMPKDTEKARSEPRELSATAVLMPPPPPPTGVGQSASTAEVRLISQESEVMRHLLAWQEGLALTIRHLLVCPILTTDTPGKGGKASRRRVGNSHVHSYSGCVFGCLLSHLVVFAKGNKRRGETAVMNGLRKFLEPASRALSSCNGIDADHLRCGFACCTVIRGQQLAISESKRSTRINSRHGRSAVAIGIGVALFFMFSIGSEDSSDAGALRVATAFWTDWCMRSLNKWRGCSTFMDPDHQAALDAERRALQRGLLAIRVAKKQAELLQLSAHSAVKLEIAFMAKAMWPANRTLDRVGHAQLCEWIHSDAFLADGEVPQRRCLAGMNASFPTPLSALNDVDVLPVLSSAGSDTESVCDSSSSAGWSSSADGDGGNDPFSVDMNSLASHFNTGRML